jgi:hypothetical protein
VLVELRAQLEETGRRLANEIASRRRAEGADDTPDQDPETDLRGDEGDESVDLQEWDNTEQVLLDLQTQLAQVERALDKFDAGTMASASAAGARFRWHACASCPGHVTPWSMKISSKRADTLRACHCPAPL